MEPEIPGGMDEVVSGVLAIYQRNPLLRMIVRLNPITSVAEAGILGTVDMYLNRRMFVFAQELISLNIDPPEDRIRKREFIDAFSATQRKVRETTNDNKIKTFAALFASYYEGSIFSSVDHYEEFLFIDAFSATQRKVRETTNDNKIKTFAALFASYYEGSIFSSVDHYEEFLRILDEISEREFRVLLILDRHERLNPLQVSENQLGRANRIWQAFTDEVESSVGIPVKHLAAVMKRLERTGLYEPIIGSYLNYGGGRGYLTPLFESFLQATKISPREDKDHPG